MMAHRALITSVVTIALVAAAVAGLGAATASNREPEAELNLSPKHHEVVQEPMSSTAEIEVGTGSATDSPEASIGRALESALKGRANRQPDLVLLHPTAGSDARRMLAEARRLLGPRTRIHGLTSDDRGVLTDGGLARGTSGKEPPTTGNHTVAVMTIASDHIEFGVASAPVADPSAARSVAASTIKNAITDAGRSSGERPAVILLATGVGIEEEVLEGVEDAVGKDAVLVGGTAAGADGYVIGNEAALSKGISFVVMYTDLPVGWVYQSGFNMTDKFSGIATKVSGQTILEIDGQPALDVYDRWLDGEVTRLHQSGSGHEEVKALLTLHSLYRKQKAPDGTTYNIFSHPWPADTNLVERGINTSTKISVGERLYLSYGNWETLLNRVGALPRGARRSAGMNDMARASFGIGTICSGVVSVIPDEQWPMLPVLINQANARAPVIAAFTWGEQGHLPGVGNRHSNATTSFLVVGQRPDAR